MMNQLVRIECMLQKKDITEDLDLESDVFDDVEDMVHWHEDSRGMVTRKACATRRHRCRRTWQDGSVDTME